MSDPKPLALIAVRDGRVGDFFWISMDGSEETCNPRSFVSTLPETSDSCLVIKDPSIADSSLGLDKLTDLVTRRIGREDVCLVESHELYAFTKDEALFRTILQKAINCLPESA